LTKALIESIKSQDMHLMSAHIVYNSLP